MRGPGGVGVLASSMPRGFKLLGEGVRCTSVSLARDGSGPRRSCHDVSGPVGSGRAGRAGFSVPGRRAVGSTEVRVCGIVEVCYSVYSFTSFLLGQIDC